MRFEDLRFISIDTELHHQYPVGCSPFVLASTLCTPPVAMFLLSVVAVSVSRGPTNEVLQVETVAMWTNVRQGDSSHPINWRDDPPQEVRACSQNFLRNAQTASVILCHFLASFATSFESPLARLSFLPVLFFKVLPITILHCEVATHASFGENSFEGRFLQPLTFYPCLPFTRSIIQNLLYFCPQRVKYSHIPRRNCALPITFHSLPRCAFFSTVPLHCRNFSGSLPCCANFSW